MGSPYAVFALFSFLLIARFSAARRDPGEYWQSATRDDAVPQTIHGLIDKREYELSRPSKKTDCHVSTKEKHFVEDFEPRPNISAYDDDKKLTKKKSFADEFEPRPNVSAYGDDKKLTKKKSFADEFEPRPNALAYVDGEKSAQKKSLEKEFEPRPNVSAYDDDQTLKGIVKDFDEA